MQRNQRSARTKLGRESGVFALGLIGFAGLACSGGLADPTSEVSSEELQYTGVTAVASSVQGASYAASRAVDGSLSTRWSSAFADPQWITVDLGASKPISRVLLTWQSSYAKDYQIRISNDNANWTTIKSVVGGDGGVDDLTGLSGSARFVQMYGTKRAKTFGYSLYEIQIFSPNTGAGGSGAGGATGVAGAGSSSGSGTAGSGTAGGGTAGSGTAGSGGAGPTTRWNPAQNTTFYWDLTNAPPDNTKNVGAYDIDGWNNTAAEVAALHTKGIKVVCYMDAGTYEPGRPDSSTFPAGLKGKGVAGWPGELWLDVRPSGPNYAALKAIMLARFKVCQQKGFDAVEPDNIDSYQNSPGFSTTAADQLAYNQWLATTVHSLGMAIFQKNDLDQVAALQPFFDGILDEECNKYSECSTLAPYTAAHKPVWDAEYKEDGEKTTTFCPPNIKAGIVGALFALDLDGSLFEPCANDIGKIN